MMPGLLEANEMDRREVDEQEDEHRKRHCPGQLKVLREGRPAGVAAASENKDEEDKEDKDGHSL